MKHILQGGCMVMEGHMWVGWGKGREGGGKEKTRKVGTQEVSGLGRKELNKKWLGLGVPSVSRLIRAAVWRESHALCCEST